MFLDDGARDARRRRSGHRQGPRQRAARPRGGGRPVRDGDRRRRGVRRLGDAAAAGDGPGDGRRAAPAELPGRLDGAEGRGGVPLRGGDRRARRDRRAHADPADRRRRRGHPGGGLDEPSADPERRRDDDVRRSLGGGPAPQGDGAPARAQPAAIDPDEPRRPAVRRRALGGARAVRARPVRGEDARPRRRGVPPPGPARGGARGERRGPAPADRGGRLGVHGRRLAGRRGARARCGRWPRTTLATAPRRRPDRRRVGPRPRPAASAVGHRGRRRRREHVRAAAAAQHPVHPRLVVLDLRRGVDQPDVLAGPAARGVQRRRDLPLPPDVRRGRLRVLVPRARRRRHGSTPSTSAAPRWRAATCSRSATGPS